MSDENNELQTWIDPELEARVVALVLGEASAFEAAELERIIAEKPELGVFKRRIESVHGLVQAASRLETDPMRMDATRRAKLLEKLGQKESVAPAEAVMAMPQAKTDSTSRSWGKTVVGIAACLLALAFLASISMPAFTSVQSRAVLTKKLAEERMDGGPKYDQVKAFSATGGGGAVTFGITRTVAPTAPAPVAAPAAAPQRFAALDNLKALAGDMKAKEDEGGDESATAGGTVEIAAPSVTTAIGGSAVRMTGRRYMRTAPSVSVERDWNPDVAGNFAQHITLGNASGPISGNAPMLKHEAAQAEQQMGGAQQAVNATTQSPASTTPMGLADEEKTAHDALAPETKERALRSAIAGRLRDTIGGLKDISEDNEHLKPAEREEARAGAPGSNSAADDKQMEIAAEAHASKTRIEEEGDQDQITALKRPDQAEAKAEAYAYAAQAQGEAAPSNSAASAQQMASDASAAQVAAADAEAPAGVAQAQAALQSASDAQAALAPDRPQHAIQARLAHQQAALEEAARSEDDQSGNDATVASTKADTLSASAAASMAAPAQMPAMQERQVQDSAQQLARNEIDSDGNTTVVQQQQIQQSQQQAQQQLAVTGNGAVPPPMNAVSPGTEVSPPAGESAEGGAPAETNERNFNSDATARINGGNTFTGGTTLNGGTVTINGIAANKPMTFNLGSQKTTATLAPALAYRGEAVVQGEQQAAGAQFSNAVPPTSYAATDAATDATTATVNGGTVAADSGRTVHLGDAQVQAGQLIDANTGTAIPSQRSAGEIHYGSPIEAKAPSLGDVPVVGHVFVTNGIARSAQVRDGNVTVAGTLNNEPVETSDESSDEKAAPSAADGERLQNIFSTAEGYEKSGQYDKAEREYDKILNADPYNMAARKGEEEVNGQRDLIASAGDGAPRSALNWQMDNGWQMPVHKFGTKTTNDLNSSETNVRRTEEIADKLNKIMLPAVEFRDAKLSDVVDFLKEKSRELDTEEPDPARRGVNIVDQSKSNMSSAPAVAPPPSVPGLEPVPTAPAAAATPADSSDPRITLSLTNIPLGDALKYVAQLTNQKLKFDPYAVSIVPAAVNTDELVTKEYNVPWSSFVTSSSIAGPPSLISQAARDFLAQKGVEFPPGASAVYSLATGRLIVRDTESNLDVVDTLITPASVPTKAALADAAIKRLQKPAPLPQDEVSAAEQPYSTFSLHVSDVSFLLAKNALAHGQMPDPEAIRPEEFYNAFDYGDPAPAAGQKIACRIEQAAHPMLQQRNLVRIAMKVAATGRGAGQPLRLTVLLDTSGSMEREDRAASVRRAMQALTSLLGPEDSVTLIGFARQPRLLAEAVPGDRAGKLVDIVKRTPAEGGTNMEEAIKAASELARRHLQAGAQNRVVMLTDGAANLGDADPEQLGKLVEKLRQQGVSFDACGVGANGFDDEILEALTRKGGGRYYFLNQPGDADEGFARELAGAFRPAAEDVKMQVRFNPSRVGNYRLIGFEKHRLKQEDFRNDKVTAAQLAAEEAAVALYQAQVLPEGEGEIGEVFVRFRDPATNAIVEQSWTIPYDAGAPALDKASPSMQLAATASLVAEKLRGGGIADAIDLDSLAPVVAQLRGEYPQQARVQDMVTMFEQTRRMTQRR